MKKKKKKKGLKLAWNSEGEPVQIGEYSFQHWLQIRHPEVLEKMVKETNACRKS